MKRLTTMLCLGPALLAAVWMPSARAVKTERVDYDTFARFDPGEFDNVSLTSEGQLELAPAMTNLATLNDPIVWCAVQDRRGNVFVGTGNQGKIYKLDPKGDVLVFFAPNEVMVHALALDHKGRLYAATSPNGRVYRFDDDGRAEVFCNPGETYIWAMTFDKDGALYLATGNHGKILRVPPGGSTPAKAETYFETDESHITALAWDKDGNLLAGTSPHGYLYRIDKSGHGFVLFNSSDNEIKQIAVGADGMIYVSTFVEKAQARAASGSGSSATTTPSTGEDTSPRDNAAKANSPSAASPATPQDTNPPEAKPGAETAARPAAGTPGPGGPSRGAIYRLDPTGFHERYWSAPDEAIYSMILLRDGSLLVGTGDKGRIYSVSGPNRWKLLQKTSDGAQVSALLPDTAESRQYYAGTSHPGWVCRLDFDLAPTGTYTSKVFDAKQKSVWGKFHPDAEVPMGTGLDLSTRSGNTDKPEKTWSDWSASMPLSSEIAVSNPPARYLQFRLSFRHNAQFPGTTARLRRLQFYYQNQNAAPVVSRIQVYPDGFSVAPLPTPAVEPPVSLDQLLNRGPRVTGSAPPRRPPLRMIRGPGLCTVVWNATDPNQDNLVYSVAIRSERDKAWTALVAKTEDSFFSFDTTGLSEGLYLVRVTASDEPANTPATARTTEETSEAFLIDNAPPVITVIQQQVENGEARLIIEAVDGASVIDSAAYSLDGKDEVALRPEDLIFDSLRETFALEFKDLSKGTHSLLLRVQDEAKNTAVLQLNFESR